MSWSSFRRLSVVSRERWLYFKWNWSFSAKTFFLLITQLKFLSLSLFLFFHSYLLRSKSFILPFLNLFNSLSLSCVLAFLMQHFYCYFFNFQTLFLQLKSLVVDQTLYSFSRLLHCLTCLSLNLFFFSLCPYSHTLSKIFISISHSSL